jgi:hypothetical protein
VTDLQVSGIYDYEVRKSLKSKGYGRDIDKLPENVPVNFKVIAVGYLCGIFWLLLSGLFISIAIFIIEQFTFNYNAYKLYVFN